MDQSDRFQAILRRIDELLPTDTTPPRNLPPGPAPDSDSDEQLAQQAADESVPAVERIAAMQRLSHRLMRESRHVSLLIDLTADPDPAVALAALPLIPPHDATGTEHLLQLCDSPSSPLRDAAALLLARRKERRLVTRLNAWLVGPDSHTRMLAMDCLGWVLRPVDAIVVLERLLRLGSLSEAENHAVERRLAALRAGWGDLEPPSIPQDPSAG